jgi:hypothetical protein
MRSRWLAGAVLATVAAVPETFGQGVVVAPTPPLRASEEPAFAVGAGAGFGTLGWGLTVAAGSPEHLQVRGVYNFGNLTINTTQDEIDYEADIELSTMGLILDFYPGGSYFRLSAGWLLNNSDYTGWARPSDSETIGDQTYTPEEIGTLRARIDVGDSAPFLGIGFGNPLDPDGRWKVIADIGILIHPDVTLELEADGIVGDDPDFQEDLEQERRDIEEEIVSNLRIYPVVSVGVTFRF